MQSLVNIKVRFVLRSPSAVILVRYSTGLKFCDCVHTVVVAVLRHTAGATHLWSGLSRDKSRGRVWDAHHYVAPPAHQKSRK